MNHNHIEYRKEVLEPFFDCIKSGESFFVIGAPSMGKTRLMGFLMGEDPDALRAGIAPDYQRIKKHYLGEEKAAQFWLARVDMNRLAKEENAWEFNFFELLLSTILITCKRSEQTGEIEELTSRIADLDSQVINSRDPLLAHRLFEMAVDMLCQSYNIRLCFLLDEFDETYQSMPRETFAQLRAIRDANKYRVSYALFLRNLPDKLRPPTENESFYELISRNMIGIGPLTQFDSFHVMQQLEERHQITLTQEQRSYLHSLSGGHPGYLQAMTKSLKASRQKAFSQMPSLDWYTKQEFTWEESRKIWTGLLQDEKDGLLEFMGGNKTGMLAATRKLLITKGLLVESKVDGSTKVFSPLFAYWLSKQ